MEHKKELVKIALAALVLASVSPVNGQAIDGEVQGIYLAAGCPAHGCPAKNNANNNDPNLRNQRNLNQGNNWDNNQPNGARNNNQPSGNRSGNYVGSPNDQGANRFPNEYQEPLRNGTPNPSDNYNSSESRPSTGGNNWNNPSYLS